MRVACFWVWSQCSVARGGLAPNECVRQLIPPPLPVLAEGVGVYITRNTASLWLELRNQERARDDDVLMVERCSAPPVRGGMISTLGYEKLQPFLNDRSGCTTGE